MWIQRSLAHVQDAISPPSLHPIPTSIFAVVQYKEKHGYHTPDDGIAIMVIPSSSVTFQIPGIHAVLGVHQTWQVEV